MKHARHVAESGSTNGRIWSREEILEAMREHVQRTGERPTALEWKRGGDHPSYGAVRRHFSSWGAAIRAAGLGRGIRGDFKINAAGRRPGHEARSLNRWNRFWSTREGGDLVEAQQRALLDPRLRDVVIGQILEQNSNVIFPKVIRTTRDVPTHDHNFETPIEPGFEPWLVEVMDYRAEIDGWAR